MTHYVELQVLTHFSLLRGASSPEELFAAAALLGYPAYLGYRAYSLPMINDITTDPLDPPRFDTLARRLETFAGVGAFDRLNLDGLLALWHPPSTN